MKAPISDRVRRILSDPALARELVRKTIQSQRGGGEAVIEVDGQQYRLERVTRINRESKP